MMFWEFCILLSSLLWTLSRVEGNGVFLPLSDFEDMDQTIGEGFFGGLFEFLNAALTQKLADEPQVNFDFSGPDCLITVGGLEGFNPDSDTLTVRVKTDTEDSGAIVTIVYTKSNVSLKEDTGSSLENLNPRLRGVSNIRSESSHIIQLPTICSATDPTQSKYTSKEDGVLRIKFPKKGSLDDLVELHSEPATLPATLSVSPPESLPESIPTSSTSSSTQAVVHERLKPKLSTTESPKPDTTLERPTQTSPSPTAITARRMSEWEMSRAKWDEF